MKRVLKISGIFVLIAVLGFGGYVGFRIYQFNDQNFVADKDDPDYADRVVKLWPDGAVPYYKDPNMTPDAIKFPFNIYADDEYELIPTMLTYPVMDGVPKAAVVIYPGGGYLMRSEKHEGIKFARFLNNHGIAAFVVNYRLSPYRQPIPRLDAEQALRLVRENAEKYNVDPERVGVAGFSAGGNLAALVSNNAVPRPAFAMLGYGTIAPVTTNEPNAASLYFKDLEGKPVSPDQSPELMIDDRTPPSFIWHTKPDTVVAYKQSVAYADLLDQQGIPNELHLFDEGRHGLGLAEDTDGTKEWPMLFVKWLAAQGFTN